VTRLLILVIGVMCSAACSSQRLVEPTSCIALDIRKTEKETQEINERVAQILVDFARVHRMSVDFGHGLEVDVGFNRGRKDLLSISYSQITKSSRGEVAAYFFTLDSKYNQIFAKRIEGMLSDIQKTMKGRPCTEIPGYTPGVLFLPD